MPFASLWPFSLLPPALHCFLAPGRRITNAMGRSPHLGCVRAMTETSCMAGCVASSCSMARLEAFWDTIEKGEHIEMDREG